MVLWEDEEPLDGKKYLYQLIYHLKSVLKEAGFDNVLMAMNDGYSIDKTQIDCDYFNYLDGDENAKRAFCGEYMFQYSWAEYTCAQLIMN
ncbi:MAG: hypothetical protein KBS66_03800 [Eubacterium sp.]|nr:hypothetical protein [Candidatus Colimonas fimequi]